jgi:hypothetical protein
MKNLAVSKSRLITPVTSVSEHFAESGPTITSRPSTELEVYQGWRPEISNLEGSIVATTGKLTSNKRLPVGMIVIAAISF